MAEIAGPIGWSFDSEMDTQEMIDIAEQVKQFTEMHMDAFGPLMQRIEQLKKEGQADQMYMMASLILTTGNSLLAYIKACEAEAVENAKN